jgi:hypothetical protein
MPYLCVPSRKIRYVAPGSIVINNVDTWHLGLPRQKRCWSVASARLSSQKMLISPICKYRHKKELVSYERNVGKWLTTEVGAIDVFRHLKISLNVISSQKINNYKMLIEGPVK